MASRLSVGYSASTASTDKYSATILSTVDTGIRVPLMHGVPPMMEGSEVILAAMAQR